MKKLDSIQLYTFAILAILAIVTLYASIITNDINTFTVSMVFMVMTIFVSPIFEIIETVTKEKE